MEEAAELIRELEKRGRRGGGSQNGEGPQNGGRVEP